MKKGTFTAIAVLTTAFVVAIILCVHAMFLPQAVFSSVDVKMRIVLDAGHGGMDGGVTGKTTGVKESDLNLLLTLALKEELEDIGFEVILTRKTEAGLYDSATKGFKRRDMEKRKEIIQNSKANIVVSLHQNFYPSKTTRGAQVFYQKEDEHSKKLALCLQSALNGIYQKEKVKARNISFADYFILQCSTNPSVLIECGFLSSAEDEKLLLTPSFRQKLVSGMAQGILAFLSEFSA